MVIYRWNIHKLDGIVFTCQGLEQKCVLPFLTLFRQLATIMCSQDIPGLQFSCISLHSRTGLQCACLPNFCKMQCMINCNWVIIWILEMLE